TFSQVRLLLDEQTRRQSAPDPAKARIDAVEVVSADPSAVSDVTTALMFVFRRMPREGCLTTSEEGRLRDVRVWTTPNERAGMALISDAGAAAPPMGATVRMTNVIAFTGKFDGGRTLRGNYTDANCTFTTQS